MISDMHFFGGRQGYVGVDSETRQGGGEYLIAASEASGFLVGSETGLRVDFDGVRVKVCEPHFGNAGRSIERDTLWDALLRTNLRSHDRQSQTSTDLVKDQTNV